MASTNIVSIAFAERSKAYEALSALKAAAAARDVDLAAAAVVHREEDGVITVGDGVTPDGSSGFLGGSLIGLLIGVFGGPVGMLFGWGAGAWIGGSADIDRVERSNDVLTDVAAYLEPGGTALIAEVTETSEQVVDDLAAGLDGKVTRRPEYEVLAEIEAATQAYEDAQKAARKKVKEDKHAARSEEFEERKQRLLAKFKK